MYSQDITLHICMYMYVATYIMINHFCYVDSYDSNNNGALIGAVVGVDCAGIIVPRVHNSLGRASNFAIPSEK